MKHAETLKIALVGHPNVGKSALFNCLTGGSATVSNYPGTTVEVERGRWEWAGQRYEVIDCPGMYGLLPITDEERVARDILLREDLFLAIHVIDAKNLERMLPLSLQMLEGGVPLILALNMMDEAERLGLSIDTGVLEEELGVPALPVVSTRGRGITELKTKIHDWRKIRTP